MKKNIVINITSQTADDFRNHVWDNYKENNLSRVFNYSNYFKLVIKHLFEIKKKQYTNFIEVISPDNISFLKRKKQINPRTNNYYSYNDTLTFRLSLEDIDKLYCIAFNTYVNEYQNNFDSFSISIFFEEIYHEIKKLNFSETQLLTYLKK